MADSAYSQLANDIGMYGIATKRACETNDKKIYQERCQCQGLDESYSGASFTFACCWSPYVKFGGCKYGKSIMGQIKKFKLSNNENSIEISKEELEIKEKNVEKTLNSMELNVRNLFQNLAPKAYENMTSQSIEAQDCRIGNGKIEDKPFSGVSAVTDFCAHSHKDDRNMPGGVTAVVTLLRFVYFLFKIDFTEEMNSFFCEIDFTEIFVKLISRKK